MNKYELIHALLEHEEDDVLLELDGIAYDIEGFGHRDAEFDGFYTVRTQHGVTTKSESELHDSTDREMVKFLAYKCRVNAYWL